MLEAQQMLQDLFYFSSSLWASTSKAFTSTPLSLTLLYQCLVCKLRSLIKKTSQVWSMPSEGVVTAP